MDRKYLQRVFLPALLLLFLWFPISAVGEVKDSSSGNTKVDKKIEQATEDQTAEKRKKITEEASSAITETKNALKALDEKKSSDALAALERASGKLTVILAREPKLALAPVGVQATTYDVLGGADEVKALREESVDLVKHGRLQQARHLLRNLASETVISVTNIPLATYPLAIKEAVRLIDQKKEEEAKTVLQTALNTLVITDAIIPLPVARAEQQLKDAEKLAENKDRKEDQSKQLAEHLKEARSDLEFAQLLGYGTEKDFKNLYEQLSEIESKTEGGKSATGFFEKIKTSVKNLFASSQSQSGKEEAQS